METCPHCERTFEKQVGLKLHVYRAHTEAGKKHKPNLGHRGWSKGLTKDTSPKLFEHFEKIRKPNSEVFVENSSYNRSHLKKRILDYKLLPYKCQECPISDTWNGKPLVLHLDHINGVFNDHRLENLRFLCPNCHSQTPTFSRGQGIKKNKERRAALKNSQDILM